MKITKQVLILLFLFPLHSLSESKNKLIDNFIQGINKEFKIDSATAIVVSDNNGVLYQNVFGHSDIENAVLATKDTPFYIASITKPIFSLALLQALESSPYSLKTTLKEMFPNVGFDENIYAEKVTIQDLLSHRSGISDQYLQIALSTTGVYTEESKLSMLALLEPSSKSNYGDFEYSNLGYNIISIWYERQFNEKWGDLVKRFVFEPLGMTQSTTSFNKVNQYKSLAKPYSFFSEERNQVIYLKKRENTLHAAGGIYSSISDMEKFLRVQLNHNDITSSNKIDGRHVRKSHQKIVGLKKKYGGFNREAYGLGWYIGDYKGELTYHHFGSFDGFRPHLSFMPKKNIGLAILNNEDALNDKLTDLIADFIYGVYLGEKGVEQRVESKKQQLLDGAFTHRERHLAREKSYKEKQSALNLNRNKYLGKYTHPLAGEIEVTLNEGRMMFSWGNLQSLATNTDHQNVLRVKFRPTRPQLLEFRVDKGEVQSLKVGSVLFDKIKPVYQ